MLGRGHEFSPFDIARDLKNMWVHAKTDFTVQCIFFFLGGGVMSFYANTACRFIADIR